jgi:hypothetical protein
MITDMGPPIALWDAEVLVTGYGHLLVERHGYLFILLPHK